MRFDKIWKKLQLLLKNTLSSLIFSNQFRIGRVILFIQSLVWVKFVKARKQFLKFSILPTDKRKSIKWFPSVFWKNWFFQKLLSIFTDLEKNCNNMQLLQTMDQTCECCIKPWYYMHCIVLKYQKNYLIYRYFLKKLITPSIFRKFSSIKYRIYNQKKV